MGRRSTLRLVSSTIWIQYRDTSSVSGPCEIHSNWNMYLYPDTQNIASKLFFEYIVRYIFRYFLSVKSKTRENYIFHDYISYIYNVLFFKNRFSRILSFASWTMIVDKRPSRRYSNATFGSIVYRCSVVFKQSIVIRPIIYTSERYREKFTVIRCRSCGLFLRVSFMIFIASSCRVSETKENN